VRAWLVLFAALSGCVGEDEVSYILVFEHVDAILDNQTPSRTWDIHLETNAGAMRDGPTWTTLTIEALVAVDNDGEWNDLWIDASLLSDEEAVDTLEFTGPTQQTFDLLGRHQADCVLGEVCTWDYPLTITRREGQHGLVGVQFDARALVTLGPLSEAPEGAALSVEARETTEVE